ncbi:hypothetical protein LUZ61_009576 [Rhynchospora tenuis]|uniref:Mediator of RNA polymerase II transcription subunit 20 n=1 Tax=Rhynchospora tenuis TaxID=198213 RepID=A0AAD5ZXH7_9POAL|nr:hypothetical protein LUZ61_009576 [Rhynchospora tenuis]
MPVKWLMHFQPNQGTTLTSQVMTEACAVAESFPGVSRDGRWRSSMTFYRAVPRDQSLPQPSDLPRDLIGISLHDLPNEFLFVMRSQRLILRAQSSVQTVIDKLQSYKGRFFINFEGVQYKWGDFKLRIGKCLYNPNESLRGIVMEVEYLPLSSMDKSQRVMEEFYEIWREAVASKLLAGQFINTEVNFSEYGLGDSYTPQHTAVLYGMCVVQVIASSNKNQ